MFVFCAFLHHLTKVMQLFCKLINNPFLFCTIHTDNNIIVFVLLMVFTVFFAVTAVNIFC